MYFLALAPISDNTLVVRFESPLHFANSARFTELCGEAIVELCSQPSTIQCTNSAKVPKSSCKKASKTLPTPAVAHLESSATVPSFSANSSDSNLPDLDVGKADETAKENVPQELSINAVAHVVKHYYFRTITHRLSGVSYKCLNCNPEFHWQCSYLTYLSYPLVKNLLMNYFSN